jgi:hypothetical protein
MTDSNEEIFQNHFDHVEIIESDDGLGNACLHISPFWKGVDRPNTGGWLLPLKKRSLAERLKRAIEAGVVYKRLVKTNDIYGQTYISTGVPILVRTMNADLKKLGY